jgi:hypothetical protein
MISSIDSKSFSVHFRITASSSFPFNRLPQDLVFMKAHVCTAWLCTAFPACHVIGGIDSAAFLAGKMLDHFPVPFFVSDFLDPGLGFPHLNPVRHLGLKRLQLAAGIFPAFPAKVLSLCRGALCHSALGLAVKAALFRTAPVALHFLKGPLKAPGRGREPCRVLSGPDEYAARGAKQPAHRGQFFIGLAVKYFLIRHDASLFLLTRRRFCAGL